MAWVNRHKLGKDKLKNSSHKCLYACCVGATRRAYFQQIVLSANSFSAKKIAPKKSWVQSYNRTFLSEI